MDALGIVIVIIIALGAYMVWKSRASFGPKESPAVAAPKTVADLDPGDGVAFWDGHNLIVESVLHCKEQVGSRTSTWRWVVLSDGRLVEIAEDGRVAYAPPEVLYQGSAPFEQLTGGQGVLKVFEQRVREGVAGSQPVHFLHGGINYQIKSTGTFVARTEGKIDPHEVLRDTSPNAGDNVYFELESTTGELALGVWTTHIAMYSGHSLQESDIVGIYPKSKEASTG